MWTLTILWWNLISICNGLFHLFYIFITYLTSNKSLFIFYNTISNIHKVYIFANDPLRYSGGVDRNSLAIPKMQNSMQEQIQYETLNVKRCKLMHTEKHNFRMHIFKWLGEDVLIIIGFYGHYCWHQPKECCFGVSNIFVLSFMLTLSSQSSTVD